MRLVRWSFDRFVPVEPDRAYAWMTDFREDDHARPAFRRGSGTTEREAARSRREVLARDGRSARIRDTWKGRTWVMDVTLHPEARALEARAPMGYRARWWVEPNPGGARVRVEGEMAPAGLAALLVPLVAKRMVRDLELDFQGHVADLVNELNPEGVPLA